MRAVSDRHRDIVVCMSAVSDRHRDIVVCMRAVSDRHRDIVVCMSAVSDRHARVAGGDSVFIEPLMFCLKLIFVASLIEPMKKRPAILKRPVAGVGDSNRPAAPKKTPENAMPGAGCNC